MKRVGHTARGRRYRTLSMRNHSANGLVPRRIPSRSLLGALAVAAGIFCDAGTAAARDAESLQIENAAQLLDALENADAAIRSFQSDVLYDRVFVLQGDRHVRYGDLYFKVEPAPAGAGAAQRPRRTFAVRFDTLFIDNVKRAEESVWVFDGQWLIERRDREKQFIKRRIAPPDAPIDPLRLGEGPIPLPIGQKKAEVLSRYDAELLPAVDGIEPLDPEDAKEKSETEARRDFVADTYQLHLVPVAERADDDDFQEIRLWYQKRDLLPRMARTVSRGGDISVVQLINIKTNLPLPEGILNVATPRREDGWDIQVEEGHFRREPGPDEAGRRPEGDR